MHSHIWNIACTVLKRKKGRSILLILTILGSVLAALVPPLVLEQMVNLLSGKQEVMLTVAFGYLLVFAVSGVLESLQNTMITSVGQSITHAMRREMSEKLQRLPADYYTKNETGQITSRFVNDVDAVDSLFTNGIISMVADAFKVISVLIVVFVKSLGLGILLCVVTPVLMYMTMVFQKRMRKAQLRNREAVARVNQHVPETIHNIRMIHTFSCEPYMEEQYDAYIQAGYEAMDQSNFYDAIYSPIVIFVSSLIIAILMVGSSLGAEVQAFFGVSVGSAVAIIAYVGKIFDPLESLGMEIQNIQSALAGVTRIDEFLNEEELPKAAGNAENVTQENSVLFENVSFGYDRDQMILHDLTFAVKKGEHVVFVGRTGAGKSTIFKLLLGLYEPDRGSVWVNQMLASQILSENRRRLFGYVEQHFAVIEGNLMEQITLFDPSISEPDVWEVLELCGLKEKIAAFPEKLQSEMKLSDFSQGELQLLSIARALAAKPEIMLLDEITANLDSVTEQRIMNIIQKAARGRTVISISHRLTEGLGDTRVITIG